MSQVIDRSETARCLAKAIAFKSVGKDDEAATWARKLVEALHCADILTDSASTIYWNGHSAGCHSLGLIACPEGLTGGRRDDWQRGYRDGHGGRF